MVGERARRRSSRTRQRSRTSSRKRTRRIKVVEPQENELEEEVENQQVAVPIPSQDSKQLLQRLGKEVGEKIRELQENELEALKQSKDSKCAELLSIIEQLYEVEKSLGLPQNPILELEPCLSSSTSAEQLDNFYRAIQRRILYAECFISIKKNFELSDAEVETVVKGIFIFFEILYNIVKAFVKYMEKKEKKHLRNKIMGFLDYGSFFKIFFIFIIGYFFFQLYYRF